MPKLGERFLTLELAGRGAFGEVFRGIDERIQEVVAIEPEPAPEQTIKGKPVSQVKLHDVEQRLLERAFQVAGVPGFGKGETPVLFVRDESRSRVFAVTLGPVTSDEGSTCVVGKPEHRLRVHGEGCQRVLGPILD